MDKQCTISGMRIRANACALVVRMYCVWHFGLLSSYECGRVSSNKLYLSKAIVRSVEGIL